MIEGEKQDIVVPRELNAVVLCRLVKYPGFTEQHLLLVELRPGHFEYVLRDWLVVAKRYTNTVTITMQSASELAEALSTPRFTQRRAAP